MSVIRYQPWGLMRSLHQDLDRLFEQRIIMTTWMRKGTRSGSAHPSAHHSEERLTQ